ADLKVISRTSASLYKTGNPRNSREIGEQLRVAHLLEGNVQRVGDRVRVNAQLIDARTDTHIWAQTYERDVADVFAIQSEIAQAIAAQLHAKISPAERAAIARPPTTDPTANALYAQALELESKPPQHANLLQAVRLLEEAVGRDPRFLLAYCSASRMHLTLYFGGYDHTPARRDLASAAIENAARIQPDAGAVHLARAHYWFHGFRDYDRAREELDLARRTLPNDPRIYAWTAAIDRRQGRFSEAVRNFERAVELDPRNVEFLMNAGFTYEGLHRYPEALQMFDRALDVAPRDYFARIIRASQALNTHANVLPLRTELNAILAEEPEAASKIADVLFYCAIVERDAAATGRALAVIPPEGIAVSGNFVWPREWFAGLAARTFNDPVAARASFTAAREIVGKIVQQQSDYAEAWSLLGRIDAGLGRKEEAIEEGRRASELLPISRDAWFGVNMIRNLAWLYAWAGEKDLAIEQLEFLHRYGKGIDYGELKLNPEWDSLRGDPRFDKILASLAPKE
ncbi:MAG: tetratricopeptide repeat protein, partial [Chthoniobacterales bacterium]